VGAFKGRVGRKLGAFHDCVHGQADALASSHCCLLLVAALHELSSPLVAVVDVHMTVLQSIATESGRDRRVCDGTEESVAS
jgi:hypothetical protein